MKVTTFFTICLLFLGIFQAFSQSPIGKWKTIDDETGKEKSIVEIYEKEGKLYGKIVQILEFTTDDHDPKCTLCPSDDDRYNKRITGMEIIRGLKKDGKEWEDGTVLDPQKGKIYDCKIWLEGADILKLRGYIAFFFRTQTWYRVK